MHLDAIGELFSKSWSLYVKRFKSLILIYLPPLALIIIGEVLQARQTIPALFVGSILMFLAIILSVAAGIALITAINKGTDFIESYQAGFKLFWAWIWIAILAELAMIGGFVMFIIPGIMLSIQLALAIYVLVLEDKHGMQALIQSREYVKGYWWAYFGRALLLCLVICVLMFVAYLPFALLLGKVAALIIYGIVLLCAVPFAMCYSYEIFDNFRRLKPNAGENAAKDKHEFLTVAMVFGAIGIVAGIILFFAALAFFPALILMDARYNLSSNTINSPYYNITRGYTETSTIGGTEWQPTSTSQ
jgi:hypothetical protein